MILRERKTCITNILLFRFWRENFTLRSSVILALNREPIEPRQRFVKSVRAIFSLFFLFSFFFFLEEASKGANGKHFEGWKDGIDDTRYQVEGEFNRMHGRPLRNTIR